MTFTREQIIARYQNDDIEILSMHIEVQGHEETIDYSVDMDPMPQEMVLSMPEFAVYDLTITYRAKRDFKDLVYYQAVTKAGITVNKREIELGDIKKCEGDNTHVAKFEPHTLPGGMFVRGTHPAHTTFTEKGSSKPVIRLDWFIEITKKGNKPHIKF